MAQQREILRIKGGVPLRGSVKAAGAKNAITKFLVASLLSDKRCIFYNIPDIGDVEVTVDLCREIGMQVQWDRAARRYGGDYTGNSYLLYSTEVYAEPIASRY